MSQKNVEIGTPRGSSIDVERRDGIVYRLRDGMIIRLDYYNSRRQAVEAAGLAE
jgi:hypothetical protein